jgi:lysosomal acid lipase/cholesteryl ester hydrolase
LNNQRGTLFSEDHTNNSISNFDYWDFRYKKYITWFVDYVINVNFSFHEVAVYDIPSQIDLMKRVTKSSNIIFIGHSQGSSSGLIYAALKNQHAKNSIKLFILMALPCYFEHNEVLRFLPFIVFPPLVEV